MDRADRRRRHVLPSQSALVRIGAETRNQPRVFATLMRDSRTSELAFPASTPLAENHLNETEISRLPSTTGDRVSLPPGQRTEISSGFACP